jgi:hypothetical protein
MSDLDIKTLGTIGGEVALAAALAYVYSKVKSNEEVISDLRNEVTILAKYIKQRDEIIEASKVNINRLIEINKALNQRIDSVENSAKAIELAAAPPISTSSNGLHHYHGQPEQSQRHTHMHPNIPTHIHQHLQAHRQHQHNSQAHTQRHLQSSQVQETNSAPGQFHEDEFQDIPHISRYIHHQVHQDSTFPTPHQTQIRSTISSQRPQSQPQQPEQISQQHPVVSSINFKADRKELARAKAKEMYEKRQAQMDALDKYQN